MAGHSKWANIQHRKGRQDAKRSTMWTKLIREIIVAVKLGGPEADTNPRLRMALLKARGANVPKDTVKNAILKGSGKLEGVNYEEIRYEGYGIGGAALMIDCTTDNRTRTVADVRHLLTKAGGNLGTDGSVSFMFKHVGYFLFAPGLSEDEVMEVALEAGADDVVADEEGAIEVVCEPSAFEDVHKTFTDKGWEPEVAEITWKSDSETLLTGEDGERMQRLLDNLEDLDDVQQVYTTAVIE